MGKETVILNANQKTFTLKDGKITCSSCGNVWGSNDRNFKGNEELIEHANSCAGKK